MSNNNFLQRLLDSNKNQAQESEPLREDSKNARYFQDLDQIQGNQKSQPEVYVNISAASLEADAKNIFGEDLSTLIQKHLLGLSVVLLAVWLLFMPSYSIVESGTYVSYYPDTSPGSPDDGTEISSSGSADTEQNKALITTEKDKRGKRLYRRTQSQLSTQVSQEGDIVLPDLVQGINGTVNALCDQPKDTPGWENGKTSSTYLSQPYAYRLLEGLSREANKVISIESETANKLESPMAINTDRFYVSFGKIRGRNWIFLEMDNTEEQRWANRPLSERLDYIPCNKEMQYAAALKFLGRDNLILTPKYQKNEYNANPFSANISTKPEFNVRLLDFSRIHFRSIPSNQYEFLVKNPEKLEQDLSKNKYWIKGNADLPIDLKPFIKPLAIYGSRVLPEIMPNKPNAPIIKD